MVFIVLFFLIAFWFFFKILDKQTHNCLFFIQMKFRLVLITCSGECSVFFFCWAIVSFEVEVPMFRVISFFLLWSQWKKNKIKRTRALQNYGLVQMYALRNDSHISRMINKRMISQYFHWSVLLTCIEKST
jgi:hypothetical protein